MVLPVPIQCPLLSIFIIVKLFLHPLFEWSYGVPPAGMQGEGGMEKGRDGPLFEV